MARSLTVGVLLLSGASAVAREDGVTEKQITLGQSASLKGPAEALGRGMEAGLNAFFARVNASGGVNGRTIQLKSINDAYEPEKCAAATTMLIEKMKVFSIIGGVGTPTAKVALPICEQNKVPFIAPFTGAELLRTPFNRYAVNLRASYFQETESLARFLVDQKGFKKIACFYQNDAFGQAGLAGITAALERRSMTLSATGTFERNTIAVSDGLKTVSASTPDAIVMVGPYRPIAEFVKSARVDAGTKGASFCTISFVGTEAFLSELGANGEGVIVSQVVPSPSDTSIPVVKEYLADMEKAGSKDDIGYVSLEGYLAGKLFAQVTAKIEGEPTREKFLTTLETAGTFDLGGFTLTFGPKDHQGSEAVFLTRFAGGKVVPLTTGGSAGGLAGAADAK
jgi:ABC-type branched-subunit amino acid transport system substrate-binding protein